METPTAQDENPSKISISTDETEYSAAPGSSTVILLRLSNQGSNMDTIEIGIRGIPSGWATLSAQVVSLGPGEETEITLTVHPPPPPQTKAGVYPVKVTALSQTDPRQTAQVDLQLRLAIFDARGRIGVMMESIQFTAAPGSSITIPILLANQGLEADSFRLSVEGLPVNWVSTQTAVTRLEPGAKKEVQLTIQPPRSPESKAGRNSFKIRIHSERVPTDAVEVSCILTIAAYSNYRLSLQPIHANAGDPIRVSVENAGNIDQAFQLTWQSPENALLFEATPTASPQGSAPAGTPQGSAQAGTPKEGPQAIPPNQPYLLRVSAGKAETLDFRARLAKQPFFGDEKAYPYTLFASPADKPNEQKQSVQGQVSGRGMLPFWTLPVLALILIGCAGLTLLLAGRARSQTAMATQTAQSGTAIAMGSTQTSVVNQTAAAVIGEQDSDGDGVTDREETRLGSDPNNPDTDRDGLRDGNEVQLGTNPLVADTDNDQLPDGQETPPCPNPLDPDSDKDGIIDGSDSEPCDANNPSLTATAAAAQPTQPPPTEVPPTEIPPTEIPPTSPPPTAAPTAEIPSTGETPVAPAPPANLGTIGFESNRDGNPEIYVQAVAGGSTTRLTDNPAADTQPAWSPDGNILTFTTNRDGNNEIYLMNADGSNPVNLTNDPGDDQSAAWSPNGQQIAFASQRSGNWEVYVVNLDGSGIQNVTNSPGDDQQPTWYSTGGLLGGQEHIAFATNRDGNFEIYRMNPDGTNPVNLTNNPADDTDPAASRNGSQIAFVSTRDGTQDIFRMEADGSVQTNLTQNPGADASPSWSADGGWIAFVSNPGDTEIYVIRADGTNAVNLTNNPAADGFPALK